MKYILMICVSVTFSLLSYYLFETFGMVSLVFGCGWIGATITSAIKK